MSAPLCHGPSTQLSWRRSGRRVPCACVIRWARVLKRQLAADLVPHEVRQPLPSQSPGHRKVAAQQRACTCARVYAQVLGSVLDTYRIIHLANASQLLAKGWPTRGENAAFNKHLGFYSARWCCR